MKYTICITMNCNLRCSYCYIDKKRAVMPASVVRKVVDFIFKTSRPDDDINIGFFGGEPLLEFDLINEITSLIKSHPSYNADRTVLTLVSNGTIFNRKITEFLKEHEFNFCISSDGPPEIQDFSRRFADGSGSSAVVEQNIQKAVDSLTGVHINAVYTPATLRCLPQVVDYFSSLGVKRIYLSPDYSAHWSAEDIAAVPQVFNMLSDMYVSRYLAKRPLFINILDNKISAILRDGFQPEERCRMGVAEFALTPSGNIYPCERLIGSDDGDVHCIGNLNTGLNPLRIECSRKKGSKTNKECLTCGVKDYCMNWCGCSNSFATGYYNRVSSFLCVSEQSAIREAFSAFCRIEEKLEGVFMEHLSGRPYTNAMTF